MEKIRHKAISMALYEIRYRARFDESGNITRYAKTDIENGLLSLVSKPGGWYFEIHGNGRKFITPGEIYYLKGKGGDPGIYDICLKKSPGMASLSDTYNGCMEFSAETGGIKIDDRRKNIREFPAENVEWLIETPFSKNPLKRALSAPFLQKTFNNAW